MDNPVIYSKTYQGMRELKSGAKNISRFDARILTLINASSSTDDLLDLRDPVCEKKLMTALASLLSLGLISVFSSGADTQPALKTSADALPMIEVTELSLQEGVQAWADTRRGANILEKRGFYTYDGKMSDSNYDIPQEPLQVLVVEDDPSLSQLLEMLLQHKNFDVRISTNIIDAIDTLNSLAEFDNQPLSLLNRLPDLVLLEVMLPGLPGKDGFHVLEYIRSHPALRHIAVIIVSSEISEQYVMRGLKADADGYIFKPFKWQTLYECIQHVTGR